MHIDPAIEPWLERLLEGVRNGNNDAEVMATRAFHATALEKALAAMEGRINEASRWRHNSQDWCEPLDDPWDGCETLEEWIFAEARAALSASKGVDL